MASRPRRLSALLLIATFSFSALSQASPQTIPKADRIVVLKAKRELRLLRGERVLKSYPIALGSHPEGPKRREGDGRTPEGVYVIDGRSARTPYHRALHISYPSDLDRARAEEMGYPPGGQIFIHGMPERFGGADPVRFYRDWTNGCIAVGNAAIEEIWGAVDDGTVITIKP